jgi:hypothetical protein
MGHGKGWGLYFFLWKREGKSSIGNRFFVHHRIVSAAKRGEFVSDWMYNIVLRGCWCNIIGLNVHTSSKRKVTVQKTVLMRN